MSKTKRRSLKNGGVYCITNTANGKVYVGSSIDLKRRWDGHKRDLRRQKHHNIKLQNAWNYHGEEKFEFSVLEYVTHIKFLVDAEQRWIDLFQAVDKEKGYNIVAIVDDFSSIWSDPQFRKEQSERLKRFYATDKGLQQRELMRQAGIARSTPEWRLAQSETGRERFLRNGIIRIVFAESWRRMREDPEFRKELAEKKKETWNEPGKKEARAEMVKALWEDPEYRESMLESRRIAAEKLKTEHPEALKKVNENRAAALRKPAVREAISKKIRLLWEDPEYRERMSNNRRGVGMGRKVYAPPCPRCFSVDTFTKGRYCDRYRLRCNACKKSSIYQLDALPDPNQPPIAEDAPPAPDPQQDDSSLVDSVMNDPKLMKQLGIS
jgi:group I intron endonuclease